MAKNTKPDICALGQLDTVGSTFVQLLLFEYNSVEPQGTVSVIPRECPQEFLAHTQLSKPYLMYVTTSQYEQRPDLCVPVNS